MLHRSETTSDQVFLATNTLGQARSADPCSDSNIAIMRKFDLASSYLQAVGYVVDGHLLCSSQGRDAEGLALHVIHKNNTSRAFPQYVLPDFMLSKYFPGYARSAGDNRLAGLPLAQSY